MHESHCIILEKVSLGYDENARCVPQFIQLLEYGHEKRGGMSHDVIVPLATEFFLPWPDGPRKTL